MSDNTPPQAQKCQHQEKWHGQTRNDEYHWLREKTNPQVKTHLEAENAYTKAVLADTEDLQQTFFEEIKARIKETDQSVPVKRGDYWYYSRTEAGKEYLIYCRKLGTLESAEEVVFDQNIESQGFEFFDLGVCEVSPDGRYLAYSIDTTGSEEYVLRLRDLQTGVELTEVIEATAGSLEWLTDSSGFYYTTRDETLRPDTVWHHKLGNEVSEDTKLWHEPDGRFYVSLDKSKNERVVFITSASKHTTEVWYLDGNQFSDTPICISKRQAKHEYYAEDGPDGFYIVSNYQAPNFRLMKCSHADTKLEAWQEIIPHQAKVTLESVEVFSQYLCVSRMKEGVVDMEVYSLAGDMVRAIEFADPLHYVQSLHLPTYEENILRVSYSSLTIPGVVYDISLGTGEKTVKKEMEISNYDHTQYESKRAYAEAEDGTQIPVSLVYKKETLDNTSAPCLLEGYGSYGISQPLVFRNSAVSLLDRGFVYAIAHVRGGGECGQVWYEEGKFLKKKNTFTDFIAVAEFLVKENYTAPNRLITHGGSAGGLLMGAVANLRPDLFAGVVADVPFVDVLNTMCDPSLPLTVMEYEEWGDPNQKEFYEYIASYAPYENISAQAYPYILALAGYNDSRVPYWEAVKWVAKLREYTTSDKEILAKVDLGQGHGGASGRYQHLKEQAFRFAFIMWVLQQNEVVDSLC